MPRCVASASKEACSGRIRRGGGAGTAIGKLAFRRGPLGRPSEPSNFFVCFFFGDSRARPPKVGLGVLALWGVPARGLLALG